MNLYGELCNDAICTYLSKADLESYYGELMNISSKDCVEANVIKVKSMLMTVNEENNSVGTNRKNEFVSQQINNLINIETYSSMSKLLKVAAWIIRFTKNIHLTNCNRNLNKYISSDERGIVLNIWLKDNHRELVKNEKYENIKCTLNLIAEKDGIIRAFGRIQRANLPDEIRKPVMLERNHKLAELILWECHRRVKHNGVCETLVEFQAQYLVTKSKSFVKKILYHCTLCRFINSRPYSYPNSPELPEIRLKGGNVFATTGIDHFGTLYCQSNFRGDTIDEDEVHKCHVVLYTCASSRGIILDLVPDTSAKEFINSSKRFIPRRGCPQKILSDNGGAFTATETQKFVAERNVKWKFTLTKALWYGAIWERLVQSVKRCLKKGYWT